MVDLPTTTIPDPQSLEPLQQEAGKDLEEKGSFSEVADGVEEFIRNPEIFKGVFIVLCGEGWL